jgi:hypothetical protein
MGSKFEDPIYRMLSREPVTPNEIANEFKILHKTALRALIARALPEPFWETHSFPSFFSAR